MLDLTPATEMVTKLVADIDDETLLTRVIEVSRRLLRLEQNGPD